MKRILLLIIPVLLLLSCQKQDSLPFVETISRSGKWNLRIGSSHAEVYSRLQELGEDKEFTQVSVVYRQPFSNPEEIQDHLGSYQGITLQNTTGITKRAVLQFEGDSVNAILSGGAHLTGIPQWPMDVPDEIAIRENDPLDSVYAKLLAIYETPGHKNYQIILPDKPLEKPFDPDMANYDEWAFYFFTDIKPAKSGRSSVRLYFKNGKLDKIRHEYDEFDLVN